MDWSGVGREESDEGVSGLVVGSDAEIILVSDPTLPILAENVLVVGVLKVYKHEMMRLIPHALCTQKGERSPSLIPCMATWGRPSIAARIAAVLTMFSRSAPVHPVVILASLSTSMSLAVMRPTYSSRMSLRPLMSGLGTTTCSAPHHIYSL